MSSESHSRTSASGGSPSSFIFPTVEFAAPLEELRKLAEKKIETFSHLADDDQAERIRQALELAHQRLARALKEEDRERC